MTQPTTQPVPRKPFKAAPGKTYFTDPQGLYKDMMDFLWEAKRNLQNPPSQRVAQRGIQILKLYGDRIEAGARKELEHGNK